MKIIHWLTLVGSFLALRLALVGFPRFAGLLFTGFAVTELVAAAILGKQSNEGTD